MSIDSDVEEMTFDELNLIALHAIGLAWEVLTLNPSSGELGEGKARRLIELAEDVLRNG